MEEETSVECVISSENEKDCSEIEVVKHDLIENEIVEPEAGLVFNSKEDVYDYYNTYAKKKGFGITKRTSTCGDDGELKYFSIECSRAGKSRCKSKFPLKSNLVTKTNCKAGVRATLRVDGKYMLSTVRLEHNHSLGLAKGRILRSNRRLDDHVKRKVELNDQDGVSVSINNNSSVVEADVHENLPFGEKDGQNHNDKARRLRLGMGDAEAKRYDRMMGEFYKVATLAADSDDKCNIVLAGIQDLILKIVDIIIDDRSMCGSNQLMLASSIKCVDDSTKMSKESCLVRSPLTVQQRGCLTANSSQSNVRKLKSSRKRHKGSSPDQEEAMPSSHTPHIVDGTGTQERSTLMGQPPSYLMGGTSMVAPNVLFQSQPTNDAVQQFWMVGSGGPNLAQNCSQVNKEEDDKMRTTVANVTARAAVGGDDVLSKWQFFAKQQAISFRERN